MIGKITNEDFLVLNQFNDKKLENNILFYGKNRDFLKKIWKLFAEYTKKIDPIVKIEEIEIRKSKAPEMGFQFHILFHKILPRPVRSLYGKNSINTRRGNCHGAALMGSGVTPVMTNPRYSPLSLNWIEKKVKKISLKNIASGDLVFIKNSDHSFVFINEDFSISMNGRGSPLKIHLTRDILKSYKISLDIFKNNSNDNNLITVFRKNKDWSYPEPIMPAILEFYSFADTGRFMLPCDRYYHKLGPIVKKLKDFSKNPPNQSYKEVSKLCFRVLTGPMPYGICQKL